MIRKGWGASKFSDITDTDRKLRNHFGTEFSNF